MTALVSGADANLAINASNANRARRRGDRMNTTAAHVVARRLEGDMAARR
jgi:hypothetical protein